jgi:hypothetical protein
MKCGLVNQVQANFKLVILEKLTEKLLKIKKSGRTTGG